MRLYGVPLTNNDSIAGHVSIAYCGFKAEGHDHRECSNRIWHVPIDKILSSGAAEDYICDGHEVHYFDVTKDACPVEEQYVSISLGILLRDAVASRHSGPVALSGVFAARIGDVLKPGDESRPGVAVLTLQRQSGGLGMHLGVDGGGPYHTTWVWTKEANNSRYDPMTDDGPGLYFF
jgi:hypothetical protein